MPKDMRTKMISMEEHFVFTDVVLLFPYHLPNEVTVKGAKSQVWKAVVVGVFLDANATSVFGESRNVKDSRHPQGQSDLGKLPLTERLELSHEPSISFTLFVFSTHVIYTMLFLCS